VGHGRFAGEAPSGRARLLAGAGAWWSDPGRHQERTRLMEIGKPLKKIVVEPIRDPVPERTPKPAPEPAPPAREPARRA